MNPPSREAPTDRSCLVAAAAPVSERERRQRSWLITRVPVLLWSGKRTERDNGNRHVSSCREGGDGTERRQQARVMPRRKEEGGAVLYTTKNPTAGGLGKNPKAESNQILGQVSQVLGSNRQTVEDMSKNVPELAGKSIV